MWGNDPDLSARVVVSQAPWRIVYPDRPEGGSSVDHSDYVGSARVSDVVIRLGEQSLSGPVIDEWDSLLKSAAFPLEITLDQRIDNFQFLSSIG